MMLPYKRTVASILFVLISFVCSAQTLPPPGAPSDTAPPPGLPIDGGILIGACVALLYGSKKLLSKK